MDWVTENIRLAFLANGQSVHTEKWLRYFVVKGYDVHLITFTAKPIKGVKIHELRYFRKFAYPIRIWNIRKAVKEIDPDILHAHYLSHYGMYGALTGFKPFVVSAWGSDVLVDSKKSMLKRYVVKHVLEKADLITVNSKSLIGTVINFGVTMKKVRLIVYGVNLKKFHQSVGKEKLKEKLKIPSSSPIIISTRSLKPIYDVETLIKAIPLVLKSNMDAYFIIVGGGSLKRKLEMMVERLRISPKVRFIDSVPHMEVAKFLRASDIYVSTSLSDATSVSLLEAMACSLPVVVTDLEGNREWIKDGIHGFLFPKRNFRVLAEKILYLLKNQDIRRKFGVVNRGIVEEKGNYEREMRNMEELYKDLLETCKA